MPPTITYGTPLAESSPFTTFAGNFASDMQLQQPTMATTGPGVPQPMIASNMNTPEENTAPACQPCEQGMHGQVSQIQAAADTE